MKTQVSLFLVVSFFVTAVLDVFPSTAVTKNLLVWKKSEILRRLPASASYLIISMQVGRKEHRLLRMTFQ